MKAVFCLYLEILLVYDKIKIRVENKEGVRVEGLDR